MKNYNLIVFYNVEAYIVHKLKQKRHIAYRWLRVKTSHNDF